MRQHIRRFRILIKRIIFVEGRLTAFCPEFGVLPVWQKLGSTRSPTAIGREKSSYTVQKYRPGRLGPQQDMIGALERNECCAFNPSSEFLPLRELYARVGTSVQHQGRRSYILQQMPHIDFAEDIREA